MMFVLMIGSLWIQSEDTAGMWKVAGKSENPGHADTPTPRFDGLALLEFSI
jgi:hypothetical protein